MISLKQLKEKAKALLLKPTAAERQAYEILSQHRFIFKKQKIFGFYILDIYIPNRLLVVEIDGGYHKDRTEHDKIRDQFCKDLGLKVLRIKNHDVYKIREKVLAISKVKNYKEKTEKIFKEAAKIKKAQEIKYNKKNGNR